MLLSSSSSALTFSLLFSPLFSLLLLQRLLRASSTSTRARRRPGLALEHGLVPGVIVAVPDRRAVDELGEPGVGGRRGRKRAGDAEHRQRQRERPDAPGADRGGRAGPEPGSLVGFLLGRRRRGAAAAVAKGRGLSLEDLLGGALGEDDLGLGGERGRGDEEGRREGRRGDVLRGGGCFIYLFMFYFWIRG